MEEPKSLAYEMLEELKRSNERLERTANQNGKRWFVVSLIELVIIISTVVAFFIYESQYSYELVEDTAQYVEETDLNNSSIDQNIGG